MAGRTTSFAAASGRGRSCSGAIYFAKEVSVSLSGPQFGQAAMVHLQLKLYRVHSRSASARIFPGLIVLVVVVVLAGDIIEIKMASNSV
jgi:hypothetical protein